MLLYLCAKHIGALPAEDSRCIGIGMVELECRKGENSPRAQFGVLGHGVENRVPAMRMAHNRREHLGRRFNVALLH